jgi:hypothetical protein
MPSTPLAIPDVVTLQQLDEVFRVGAGRFTGPLTVPWPENETQGFWERYLNCWTRLAAVGPRDCRRAVAPLRVGRPIAVEADGGGDARVGTECFLHPWGASVVVTINLKALERDHAKTIERLLELRYQDCFVVNGETNPITLEEVADAAFDRVRTMHSPGEGEQVGDAFSVLTLMNATGDPAAFDPATEPTAKFLHAATSFSLTWQQDTLPPLAEATVARLSHAPATHLIYGSRRSRAVWGPSFFLTMLPPSTLTCLHRNQTLAAMQTEAMSRFVVDTVRRMEQSIALSAEHKDRSRFAAEALGRLYRGDNDTYRSGSTKALVLDGRYKDPINRLLKANLRPELT